MGRIGIIGAMEEEVAAIKEKMEVSEVRQTANLAFYVGKMEEKEVVVVRCGIGKVNAAICTQILVDQFEAEAVINTGVAGGIYGELEIGDIVISTDAVYHDFDTTVFGYDLGVIPRMEESFFKADQSLIEAAKKAGESLEAVKHTYTGRVVSGDQFISSGEVKEKIWTSFQGYCTEMEGAAIAHTCYLNQVPFVIIRSISDKADDTADMSFEEFVEIAAKNSSDMILKIVGDI